MSLIYSIKKAATVGIFVTAVASCGGGGSSDSGSSPTTTDTTAPVITLNGESSMSMYIGDTYVEPGASATDNVDGNVTVEVSGQVNTSVGGDYTVTYVAKDKAGNTSSLTRTITIVDNKPPVLTLNGAAPMQLPIYDSYVEPGVKAVDETDGELEVTTTGTVNSAVLGQYEIVYSATDNAGNQATISRKVVVFDGVAPVITLNGDSEMSILDSEQYIEAGAKAVDNVDGDVEVNIKGLVDLTKPSQYIITYSATDSSGNESSINREVTVIDGTAPVITLKGESSMTLFTGDKYNELGAEAIDNVDGNVLVTTSGSFDINTAGTYVLTYTAVDSAGNQAAVTRTIEVKVRRPFITTWSTTNDGVSLDNQLLIQVRGDAKYSVDWGDGSSQTELTGDTLHTYRSAGIYTITINSSDDFSFYLNEISWSGDFSSDNHKLLSIVQWGDLRWSSMESAFADASNLVIRASDVPNLSQVTSMRRVFLGATLMNSNVANWNVSNVTDMSYAFAEARYFNQNIAGWDVSNVTDMSNMFNGAWRFDQYLGDWNVSKVENMSRMFYRAVIFNQPLNDWDVSKVSDFSYLFGDARAFDQDLSAWDVTAGIDLTGVFLGALAFNQDISSWDVSNSTDMAAMFAGAESFNQNIGNWDVSNVTSISSMFKDAKSFNQDISSWDLSNVTSLLAMFHGAESFNQDIGNWNVAKVTNMTNTFRGATAFNQDIGGWDVSSVNNMNSAFREAKSFNQDIGSWDVSNVTNMWAMFFQAESFNKHLGEWDVAKVKTMTYMFRMAYAFERSLGQWDVSNVESMLGMFDLVTLTSRNYDATLLGWSSQRLQPNVSFGGGQSQYTSASAAARQNMIDNFNWTISDSGLAN